MSKLPPGFDNLNVSGGEPTLRKDLAEIADLLYPKARVLEISSNGLHPERLVPIIKKYPNIKVRFSVEGDQVTSDTIRGEKGGYATKVAGLRMLKEAGGTDLGFAMVIRTRMSISWSMSTNSPARKATNSQPRRSITPGSSTRTTTIFMIDAASRARSRGSSRRC